MSRSHRRVKKAAAGETSGHGKRRALFTGPKLLIAATSTMVVDEYTAPRYTQGIRAVQGLLWSLIQYTYIRYILRSNGVAVLGLGATWALVQGLRIDVETRICLRWQLLGRENRC